MTFVMTLRVKVGRPDEVIVHVWMVE